MKRPTKSVLLPKTRARLKSKADINKNKKIEPWEAARSKVIQKSMSKKKYEGYLSRGLKGKKNGKN